jgi:hypothetical protein
LSSTRTQATGETFVTTRSNVGLLPTGALSVSGRTATLTMSSLHGPPATGPGDGSSVADGAAAVVGAGVGTTTAASDGSTCSRAGVGAADALVAAPATGPGSCACPVATVTPSQLAPPSTPSVPASTSNRRRQ